MKYSKPGVILLVITLAFLNGYFAQSTAQSNTNANSTTPTPKPTETPTPSSTPSPTPSPTPLPNTTPAQSKVTDIYRLGYIDKGNKIKGWDEAGIGDIIVVEVENLKTLRDRSLCLDDKGKEITVGCKKQEIALFLDERKIAAIPPEAVSLQGANGTLQFHLKRSAGNNDETWADLLGNPPIGEGFFPRKTKVSVGLENEYAMAEPKQFTLIRIREYRFWIFTILYLFLLFLLYRLAVKSDILRDIGEAPNGSRSPASFGIFSAFKFGKDDEKRKPYSLARFQMAFWFLLVIGSFSYIWLITGAYDIITTEVLALIGIGAGTALGAAAIDVGKRETANTDLSSKEEAKKDLETKIAELQTKIDAAPPDPTALKAEKTAKEIELAETKDEIAKINKGLRPESEGFLKDVLTDATGVSFHRFQIFIWTLVLGVIFIISVWTRLSMPEFGATLLALLGISAGTYLGFKIPEKQTPTG